MRHSRLSSLSIRTQPLRVPISSNVCDMPFPTSARSPVSVYQTPRDVQNHRSMASAPIILVPGFWLGAWAWDEVAAALRAEGHDVTALTLPGLESAGADRSSVTFGEHVDAICDAVTAAGRPVL